MKPIDPAFVKKEILLFNLFRPYAFFQGPHAHVGIQTQLLPLFNDSRPFFRLHGRIASSFQLPIVENAARF